MRNALLQRAQRVGTAISTVARNVANRVRGRNRNAASASDASAYPSS